MENKKRYQEPTMEVVALRNNRALLTGTGTPPPQNEDAEPGGQN